RLPAERIQLFNGVTEARNVPNPSFIAAGVMNRPAGRCDIHDRVRDKTHGGSIVLRAGVEAVPFFRRVLLDKQHGVEQFRDMQIRFLLRSIAQHFERIGIRGEFAQEIEDNAVRGAWADHVRKAENPGALEKTLRRRADYRRTRPTWTETQSGEWRIRASAAACERWSETYRANRFADRKRPRQCRNLRRNAILDRSAAGPSLSPACRGTGPDYSGLVP